MNWIEGTSMQLHAAIQSYRLHGNQDAVREAVAQVDTLQGMIYEWANRSDRLLPVG